MPEDTPSSTAMIPSGGEPRFAVGAAVRVRHGVADPDFPDMPLGGWAGHVVEIDDSQPALYLVAWSEATHAGMPTAFRVRCDREGMDGAECWLAGVDLEPDDGGPPAMEQPTGLVPLPLDPESPPDRVRAIFGKTSDDPLPGATDESLRRFHEHFRKVLKLPASVTSVAESAHRLLVLHRLLPPDEADADEGLLAEVKDGDESEVVPLAELELMTSGAAAKDLGAYAEWLANREDGSGPGPAQRPFPDPVGLSVAVKGLGVLVLLACVALGALLGALLATVEGAWFIAQVGAGLLGALGALIGARVEGALRRLSTRPNGFLVGAALGFVAGGLAGAAAGVLLQSYLGAIPGAIAGTVLGQLLAALGVRNHRTVRLTLLGGYVGALTYPFLLDAPEAARGCGLGAAAGVGLYLLVTALFKLAFGGRL